jgi:flagellar protein FliO/FliZ
MEILSWLFFIIFIGALIVVGGLLLKGYVTTGSPTSGLTGISGAFFGPKPEKRLEIMDQFNVDGRRRLVLVRRDDVEHLIMTGGPVDIVIETGIAPRPMPAEAPVVTGPMAIVPERFSPQPASQVAAQGEPQLVEPSVFSRAAPRPLGTAVGDN